MKKTDARVRYTQMIIKKTFLELLKEKPVRSITVKEICEKADINRTTFYKHYQDCYDLLDVIEKDAADALLRLIDENSGVSSDRVLLMILQEIYKHKDDFLSYLHQNNGSDFLYRTAMQCFMTVRRNSEGKDTPAGNFLASPANFGYFAGGIGGVIGYWTGSGMTESPEKIAEKIHELSRRLWE